MGNDSKALSVINILFKYANDHTVISYYYAPARIGH